MEKTKIIAHAINVIEGLKKDFNNLHYESLGGELNVLWSKKTEFNASASSEYNPTLPPKHSISLTYELVVQVYRDGEFFYDFLSHGIRPYSQFFATYDPPAPPSLPESFKKEEFLNNFFVASLTWIFAHELGHLTQEHGHIRMACDPTFGTMEIHELDAANSSTKLSERAALVSHATELAADYEANNWCVWELVRHFSNQPGHDSQLFTDGVFVFLSALTCTFYRFNGLAAREPQKMATGSHPHPIFRIEKNISHVIEMIDSMRSITQQQLSRAELVHLYHRASMAATAFWLSQHAKPSELAPEFFIGGIINHSNMLHYMPKLIDVWDEIEPKIRHIKRFKIGFKNYPVDTPDLGIMIFTKNLRDMFPPI